MSGDWISPRVEDILSVEQAGFRPGRSSCDQVSVLTTFIENGYQRNLKTGAVFLDLSAAYDTVWHTDCILLVKLSRSQPIWVADTVETLLRGRQFRVHMGSHESSWRHQINGLQQGAVLAPSLFNLHANDLPKSESRKFTHTIFVVQRKHHLLKSLKQPYLLTWLPWRNIAETGYSFQAYPRQYLQFFTCIMLVLREN